MERHLDAGAVAGSSFQLGPDEVGGFLYAWCMSEQLPFTVVRKFPDFEIRRYADYVLAQVQDKGGFNVVSFGAFSPLFRYISGANSGAQKISMTSPVLQETVADDTHVVSFVMPATMGMERVPDPNSDRVTMTPVAAHDAVAMSFGGTWSTHRMHKYGRKLRDAVEREGLVTEGNLYVARYDPPWTPWFLKHNEVLFALAEPYTPDEQQR